MRKAQYYYASSGALTLRPTPETKIERLLERLFSRRLYDAYCHKRRTRNMEDIMYPEYIIRKDPALAVSPTIGPFGSCLVPFFCREQAAYHPTSAPARPGFRPYCAKMTFASLLPRCPK